jgi:DNA-binding transcriptional ArsR family regulator
MMPDPLDAPDPLETPESAEPPILPETAPVTMPDLPAQLVVNQPQQYKALGDPMRNRILRAIQSFPLTAKQVADRLGIAPGTASHHLQVLEEAGLAQLVARRMVRGIVAKYYTRTARIFLFDPPYEIAASVNVTLDIVTNIRDELAESQQGYGQEDVVAYAGFPHVRLTKEHAMAFRAKLEALAVEFNTAPSDPDGIVFGLGAALFIAPPYAQADAPDKMPGDE